MGSLTWHGWQTSLEDVFGATGILYGGNLRKRLSEDTDQTSERAKDDEKKGTNVSRYRNRPVPPRRKKEPDKEG